MGALRTTVGLSTICGLLLAQVACVAPQNVGPSEWLGQLVPDSVCYDFNLADGFDTSTTDDFHSVFSCLNKQGHLIPFAAVDETIDLPTRLGVPIGVEVFDTLDALGNTEIELDVDVGELLNSAIDLLQDEDLPIDDTIDVLLELVYGQPPAVTRSETFQLHSRDDINGGLVSPLRKLGPVLGTHLLEPQGQQSLELFDDVLRSETTVRWLKSLEAYTASTHPGVEPYTEDLIVHLGEALQATLSPENDRWSGASGNSLRDLSDVFLTGSDPVLPPLADDLDLLLQDQGFRERFEDSIERLHQQGSLQQLPAEIAWFASVDVNGNSLSPGEDSALTSFLRLLHSANQPATCTIDIFITDIDIELGNVSVALMNFLADQDATFVVDGSNLISGILDVPLSEDLLNSLATSGACTVVNPQLLEDIQVVNALYQPEAYELLVTVLDLLSAMKYADENQLERLADIASDLYLRDAAPPLEEVLRDLGPTALMSDIINLTPVLIDPAQYRIQTEGVPVADMTALIDLIGLLVAPLDDRSGIGWDRLAPMAELLVNEDATWTLLTRASVRLTDPQTTLTGIGDLLPESDEPTDYGFLETAADLLDETAVRRPILRILEEGSMLRSLFPTQSTPDGQRTPVPYLMELATDGTLDDLLRTVRLLLSELDLTDDEPTSTP